MFSLSNIKKIVSENDKAASTTKCKEIIKRKRQLSSNETESIGKKPNHKKSQSLSETSGSKISNKKMQELIDSNNKATTEEKISANLEVSKVRKKKTSSRKAKKKKGKVLDKLSEQECRNDVQRSVTNGVQAQEHIEWLDLNSLDDNADVEQDFENDGVRENAFTMVTADGVNGLSSENVDKEVILEKKLMADGGCKPKRKRLRKKKKGSGVSNEGMASKLTQEERVQLDMKLNKETEVAGLSLSQSLVSCPLKIFTLGKEASLVLLSPGQSLYIQGLWSIETLLGIVTIFGYKMDEFEKQNVFSMNSHALLSIKAAEGSKFNLEKHSYLLEHGLSDVQLQEIAAEQKEPVVIVKLQRGNIPFARKLSIIGMQHLMLGKGRNSEAEDNLIITPQNCDSYNLLNEPQEWQKLMEDVHLYYECGNVPCIIVCGGKSMGKSTLFKYIVNGLLTKNGTPVQCLDLDPGQSELCMPSCLSLTTLSDPLLGPPYSHHSNPHSPNVKHLMIGGISPQFGLQRYLKALKSLFEMSKKHPKYPLVVNTMGWNLGTGLDLILDTIRIMNPSHVVQIDGTNPKGNFPLILQQDGVQSYLGGVCTVPNQSELHYHLIKMRSLSVKKNQIPFSPQLSRETAVMMQLSDVLIDMADRSSEVDEDANTMIVPWPDVAIHVCQGLVPKERILQVINGNLVALCQVQSSKVVSISPDLPKQLVDDMDFGHCWGWGVVRGIDPLTKSLHILTSSPAEVIKTKVNAIFKPDLHLPEKFYKYFTQDQGPYFQAMFRSGAAKLKIGRKIKPNMAKLKPRGKK